MTAADSVTPIWISRRTGIILGLAAIAALVYLVNQAPTILILSLGGFALAIALSAPVRWLAQYIPKGGAIAIAFVTTGLIIAVLIAVVVPILVEQLGALANAAPDILQRLGNRVPSLLDRLAARGLLPTTPEQFLAGLRQELLDSIQAFAGRLVGGLGRMLSGVVSVAITLFGIVFIAAYLLADARRLQACALRAAPHRYRRDVAALWDAFSNTLSRYIGGLGLSLAIQGVLSAVALYFIGVPYALLLGVWVAVTALIPYLGAWIGAIPAVLLALSVSPMSALVTAILFLLIQQLEGNFLTPRIQSQAVRVHPLIVFLGVIAGSELFGILGAVFAVPTVAVLRVLFDFFRARLRVRREVAGRGDTSVVIVPAISEG